MPTVAVLHYLDEIYEGLAGPLLREAGVDLDVRHPAGGDPLPRPGDVDGIVVLGGKQSVAQADEDPLLGEALFLLREALTREIPVLGICLGSQLLARAGGGAVRHAGRAACWRDLTPTPAAAGDPLFGDLEPPVPALHVNEDVFDLPPGAEAVLERTGPGDGVEAFRLGPCAWGVQHHPDADTEMLDRWLSDYAGAIVAAGGSLQELRAESERRMPAQIEASRKLFSGFASVVSARAA
jgi:GMP synthase (glutamine-hydrolysing)